MNLIIGLGNPGKKYDNTRHNVGFFTIDKIALKYDIDLKVEKKFKAIVGSGIINEEKTIIVKPQTFMNESGISVKSIIDFYKIPIQNILVIHDDKDIPLGKYRKQTDRGPAGHNGIKSIISNIGTQNFTRFRIGILAETPIEDTADFVLSSFSKSEKETINNLIEEII